MLITILVIVLVLVLLGSIPAYRHNPSYGWGGGLIGLILIILLILALTGHL